MLLYMIKISDVICSDEHQKALINIISQFDLINCFEVLHEENIDR